MTVAGLSTSTAVSAVAVAAVTSALAAAPAAALTVTDTIDKSMTFTAASCAPVTRKATLPAGLRRAELLRPKLGAHVYGFEGEAPGRVTAAELAGRTLTVTVTPDAEACAADDEFGEPWEGDTFDLTARVRARRDVKVWVRGTGRGDNPAIRPRVLPFGLRSAVVGTRWSRWGGHTAVGRGQVEFNSCVPNCAQARPQYFPARVVLERPRKCGSRWQYTRFRFRYTSARCPAGGPATYREFFGC